MKKTFLTQFICFFLILLSCLTIGFGSWLETNALLHSSSPTTSQHLSIFKVTMVNGSDIAYLTFGLWRYCVFNVSINTNKCSYIKMNFDIGNIFSTDAIHVFNNKLIDAFTAMNHSLTTNNDQLPPLSSVSYVRLIPLLITTIIAVVSLGISLYLLPGNRKKSVQRRGLLWFISALSLINASLVSITFGVTFHQYSTDIRNACSLILSKNGYICQSYTPSVEITLLGLAIGLFTISAIYCMMVSCDNQSTGSCRTQFTTNSNFSFYASEEDHHQTTPTIDINETQSTEEMVWNNNKERLSLHPPPPFINNQRVGCRSTTDNSPLKVNDVGDSNADINCVQHQNNSSLLSTDIKLTSSIEDVLLPPTLPFANHGGRSTYNHNNSRPLSHGSGNTFGAFSGDPNSPSADDASQSSSYIDHQRSDSSNSQIMYATHGTQSNHTLGTFQLTKPNSQSYCYYNSSFEGGENLTENETGSNQSVNIPEKSSSHATKSSSSSDILFKRINNYLRTK